MKKKTLFYVAAVTLFSTCFMQPTVAQDNVALKNNVVLKLTPGAGNPRNSEGSFVTLKNGKIMFVYSRYTSGNGGDHDPAYLAARYSSDGGKTWSKDDVTIVEQEGDMNVMSVSLLRLQNGQIALFYLKKNSEQDCIPLVRFSKDEGNTWSEPVVCITDKKGYFVLNNDRVIQLKNGRLLMAVALHQVPGGKWKDRAQLFSYYSDDQGKTWKAGTEVDSPSDIITQEPGVVELKDGRVMMFIRASANAQLVSYSSDKGHSWTRAVKYNLNSPLSPASIERIPSTGDLFAIWNDNDGSKPAIKGKRTPLTIAISKDEGKSWQHIKNIEIDPDGWYCYMGIHFDKKNVLLAYCAGSQKEKTHLAVTDIALLALKDIYKK